MASSARLDELKKKFDENPRRYFAPLANEHRKSGDLDQAIALCRTHLPQQPAHISGHIVLAQALFEAGSLDESREIFHTALGLDPENLIALRYLGDIARDADDVATARSWYQRVLEVDPRNDEIVQLVRDLDAPRPAPSETADGEDAPSEPASAPAATPVAAAPAPENDPRFAPLSLEHVDFDAAPDAAPAEPNAEQASEAPDEEASFDVHAAWSTDSPTVELPTMDGPELDPFDVHPSASADSLYDGGTSTDDLFMDELSDLSSPNDTGIDPEYSVGEAWGPSPESEPAGATPGAAAEPTEFEEGSFYLEPAPEAGTEAPVIDDALIAASTAETAAWELPSTSEPVASTEASPTPELIPEPELTAISELDYPEPVADATPNADPLAIADAPTAEWQAPVSFEPPAEAVVEQELGLEVMEFVPPSSHVGQSADLVTAPDSDPMLGRTPELASAQSDHGGTPAAFVTETMAELYLQQGFRNEALAVYRELLARNPADSSLRDRIDQIESGSTSSIGIAAVSEDVVESALRRQSARPARSVRSFFASLAGRRAPYQHAQPEPVAEPDVSAYVPVDETPVQAEASAAPETLYDAPEPAAPADPATESRNAPLMSAAETLASFDPFADATDLEPAAPDATDAMPNVDLPSAVMPASERSVPELPVPELLAPESSAPEAVELPAREEPPARSSLEALFPDAPVTPRTEAAAQTLATAFGRQEPQGRPTRAASSELSLDKVFRGSPEGAPPADGGFSFDQFFSDARPAGSDVAAPTMSPPEMGRSGGGAGDAHDIEQFTAWLEGLKKK